MVTVVNAQPHVSVIKEAICSNCGVTLQYTPAEVKSHIHYDYGGGSDMHYTIKCPNCNKKVYVDA